MDDIQIVVKFQRNKGVYVNFESVNKKKVDWDSITDEQYINMMEVAITTIADWREKYIAIPEVA